jgi:hypothetical protein
VPALEKKNMKLAKERARILIECYKIMKQNDKAKSLTTKFSGDLKENLI